MKEDICKRRIKQGILEVKRPICISEYNPYMGGVDLSDQRRLYCESRVHRLQRCWNCVFFYYIGAGTVNSMVLYRKFNNNVAKLEAKQL